MFGFSLEAGAVLLRKAVAAFIMTGCFNGEMFISNDNVTLAATTFPIPMFQIPSLLVSLRLRPLIGEDLYCTEGLLWLALSFRDFYNNLSLYEDDDDFFGIYGSADLRRIRFVLVNNRTERFWDQQMDLFTIERGRMIAPEFHYEYDVVVGIPSGIFGSLIMNLSRFGMTVSALVTETQVTFTVGNVKIVLRKELEECIIGGAVGENPVSLVFHIHYSNTMLRSSFLSKRVWVLGQSNGSSVMLNCPVGTLGNLMFYVG
ncbi:hypothetical protein ACFX1S_041109 [Malus domestica]